MPLYTFNYNEWTYVPLHAVQDMKLVERDKTMTAYLEWLFTNVAEVDWEWDRGDMVGRGIYFRAAESATAFKLMFIL